MRRHMLVLSTALTTGLATFTGVAQASPVGTAIDPGDVTMSVTIGNDSFNNIALNWDASFDEETQQTTYALTGDPIKLMTTDGSESYLEIGGASFNPDPYLIFSASATNNSNNPLVYSFSFNTPLSPALSGAVASYAELRVALTDGQNNGASVKGIGGNEMLESFDFDSNNDSISKNVDIAPQLVSAAGAGGALQFFSASSSLNCALACVTMNANLRFSLTAHDSVGFSGKVEQTPVPVPAAALLLGSGLAGLLGMGRRRRAAVGA